MRQTDPPGGGSNRCGIGSASRRPLSRAGVRSVTHIRAEANPGRAGSEWTSAGTASDSMCECSPWSTMTIRLTDLASMVFTSVVEIRTHHDEGHLAALVRIGPGVPASDLHHDVAG